MTDLELLEQAARAIRLKKDDSPYNGGGAGNDGFDCTGAMVLDWHNGVTWNPLRNDGDALRLAVSLRLAFAFDDLDGVEYAYAQRSEPYVFHSEDSEDCPYAATRRAIVVAAAKLGERMGQK